MLRTSMIAAVAASLLCVSLPTAGGAHVPNECVGHVYEAQERVDQYTASLKVLRGLPASELSSHMPEMDRVELAASDTLEATVTLLSCMTGEGKVATAAPAAPSTPSPTESAGDGDREYLLDEVLAFAEQHEFALNTADRCFAIFYELIYDARYSPEPFLDQVMAWVRSGSQVSYETIKLRINAAQDVLAEMERSQITDRRDFAREYVRQCQEDYIRTMAGQ